MPVCPICKDSVPDLAAHEARTTGKPTGITPLAWRKTMPGGGYKWVMMEVITPKKPEPEHIICEYCADCITCDPEHYCGHCGCCNWRCECPRGY